MFLVGKFSPFLCLFLVGAILAEPDSLPDPPGSLLCIMFNQDFIECSPLSIERIKRQDAPIPDATEKVPENPTAEDVPLPPPVQQLPALPANFPYPGIFPVKEAPVPTKPRKNPTA
ncbi:uncharacterized protein LOC120418420 [Culex pipiens pallens]|uniref:uncharacterized protein LOC120418420 n=1 Tax=Culex pipiens pallens TaxID=42434 RepID=UPI001953A5A1|nr:uncharacterized protein LOC120418420 [Culex pipiens pallens]